MFLFAFVDCFFWSHSINAYNYDFIPLHFILLREREIKVCGGVEKNSKNGAPKKTKITTTTTTSCQRWPDNS